MVKCEFSAKQLESYKHSALRSTQNPANFSSRGVSQITLELQEYTIISKQSIYNHLRLLTHVGLFSKTGSDRSKNLKKKTNFLTVQKKLHPPEEV